MKLVDMKRSKKATTEKPSINAAHDPYSYGMRLNLDAEQIKKLGISMPKVGAMMKIEAVACVCSTSQHEHNDGGSKNVELQIQKLGVEKHVGSLRDAVDDGVEDSD